MKITIEPIRPDGINVDITEIYLDTFNEVFEIIKLVEAIKKGQKIDIEKVKKSFG